MIIGTETKKALNDNLMLFFTGISRFSSDIQIEQERNLERKNQQLLRMIELVDEAEKALVEKRIDDFGALLDYEWRLKREINGRVSNPVIDATYAKAISAGALGGKLLGAGGGGFLLFYAPADKQISVRRALADLMEIPFRFENGGSKIVYYASEVYDSNKRKFPI